MKMKKTIISTAVCSLLLPTLLSPTASVKASEVDKVSSLNTSNIFSSTTDHLIKFNDEEKEFLNTLQPVLSYFYFDEGELKISLSEKELKEQFGYDEEFITTINDILHTAPVLNTAEILPQKNPDNIISPMMHVSGGKIWLTYDDIRGTLTSAAMIGPAAVYAAFVGLGTVTLGPVGTAIIAAVGILGFPSLAGFTYSIIQASVNRQGVFIGVEMNGVFPNIVSGTW